MRVLVTGGAGFIGSHTVVELLASGHEVLVLDDFSNSSPKVMTRIQRLTNRAPDLVEADILDTATLTDTMLRFGPEAVIHFAGAKAVGESVRDPIKYYRVNVQGSVSLLDAMKAAGCNKIVFSSSATVYGEPDYLPMDEDHPLRPQSPYGRSKLQVEQILRDQATADPGFSAAVLRYFNPVGAHPSGEIGENPLGVPDNLMPLIAQVAVGRRPHLDIYGEDYDTADGTGMRDYLHVVDLARAHVAALAWLGDHHGWRAFNLGMGQGLSVRQVIAAFEQASGVAIETRSAPRRPGDVPAYYADPGRARRELGWAAKRDLAEVCRSVWKWQSRNPSGY